MSESAATIHIDEGVFGRSTFGRPHGAIAQAVVVFASLVAIVIFAVWAKWVGLPELEHYDGSLLMDRSPAAALAAAAVLIWGCTLVGTLLAGCVRFEAGLFAACIGLMVLSLRSGTSQSVLFEANGDAHVFITLASELILLGLVMGGAWVMLWLIGRAGMIQHVPDHGPADPAPGSMVAGISALVAQVIATGIILIILCQSQAKYQALASVFIASAIGTMISYGAFPARPSVWFWSGAMLVGVIGYLLAASGQDSNLAVGVPEGTFAALARPLPLDYASLGTAGAIFGYWTIRNKRV
jgi:hypothetical protein